MNHLLRSTGKRLFSVVTGIPGRSNPSFAVPVGSARGSMVSQLERPISKASSSLNRVGEAFLFGGCK